jgi:hypothetical protein
MYKLELSFDTSALDTDSLEKMCEQTDEIFAQEDLTCENRQPGRRIYLDRGRKQDYGRFWAAIFALKNSAALAGSLKECVWYNGTERENLITDFMRN